MTLLKNSSIYTIGNLAPAAAGFLLLPVYSRYLSPEEYAVIAAMEVLAYLYGVFVNFNLERAAYRFYFDKDDEQWRKDLFFTIHNSSIAFAIVWMLVALLLQDIITLAFPSIPFWPIYMLVLGRVTVEVILRVPQQYFQVAERPVSYVSISLVKLAANVLLILWFLIAQEDGVQGILTGNLIAAMIMIPIGVYVARKYFRGKYRTEILVESFQFAWPFIPTLVVAWVLNLSDRIFLEYYAPQVELGLYGMAYKIASAYFLLMGAYHTAYLPRYYKHANMKDQATAPITLAKDAKANVVAHIIICFLMILWIPELIEWFLSSEYSEVTDIVRIILISHLFGAIPAVTHTPALLQAKKTKINMYAAITASVINVGMNFILIPPYGMYGAATATVISIISLFVIQYVASRSGYLVIFPWRILLISLTAGSGIVSLFVFVIEENLMIALMLKGLITIISLSISYNILVRTTHMKADAES